MKAYADHKARARHSRAKEGDTVIVKKKRKDKFSTNFGTKAHSVVQHQGSMVNVEAATGQRIARNATLVKKEQYSMFQSTIHGLIESNSPPGLRKLIAKTNHGSLNVSN